MSNKDEKDIYDKLSDKKKFCFNCKFYLAKSFEKTNLCLNEKNRFIDLVNGKIGFIGDAYSMRSETGACGPDGKLFEQVKNHD